MSKLVKKRKPQILNVKNRKKHVESMFLTNKTKHHFYYHKNRRLFTDRQTNPTNLLPNLSSASIRILESGYLTIKPLKSIMRLFKWFLKNHSLAETTKLNLKIFPDFVLTSKPREIRMGKGKGANVQKVAVIKEGQILFNIPMNRDNSHMIKYLIKKISFKVPLKHCVILNEW